ncbi:MAG: tetratricopeptide repeat protein, partial [Deltaproteobacteria bacterium]|nr:tetratricopeptide repeat protein [Deltaproteobacteria bacterium]
YLIKAGQKLQQAYANREALTHYNRALAICERLGHEIDPLALLTIYAGKGAVHLILSQFLPAGETYQRMLEVARQSGDQAKEAEALYRTGFSFFFAHEFEKALDYAEQANVLASAIGAKNILAGSIFVIGHVHQVTGKIGEAARLREESLRISREAGDKSIEAFSLSQLGMLHNWMGEYEQALPLHEQAVTVGHTHNLQFLLLHLSWTKGLAYCGRGEYEKALASLQEDLELSERLGDKFWKGRILNTLGWVYGELHNLEMAIRCNKEGVELSDKPDDPEIIRNAQINLGDDYLLLGAIEQAQHYLEKVYRDSQQRGKWGEEWMKWRYLQHCCHSLGELWLTKGDAEKALRFAEECLQLAEPTQSRKNIVKGWRLQGQALCMQGRLVEAEAVLQKALALAQEVGNPPQLWKTYQALGELYGRQGAIDQARSAYASALEVIEAVASRLQDQEIKQTFLAAKPVQELQERLGQLT